MKFCAPFINYLRAPVREKLNHNYTVVFAAFIIALSCFLFGEKIPAVGMYGDEIGYTERTKDLYNSIFVTGLNSFHLQRILPPAVVHYSIRLFSLPLNNENILLFYGIYDVVLVTVIAYVWCLLVRELDISNQGKWLGFTALFINFPILKYYFYIPISTDCFAYAISIGMIYCYLRNHFIGLSILILLALLTWPTLVYVGIILALFPADRQSAGASQPAHFFLNYVVALMIVGFLGYKMIYWFTGERAPRSFSTGIFTTGANQPLLSVLYLSIGVAWVYLFAALSMLLNNRKFFEFKYWWSKVTYFWFHKLYLFVFILLAASVYGIKTYLYHISVRKQSVYSFGYLLKDTLGESIIAPGVFLVSHVVFYGPIILLMIFLWKPLCNNVQRFGAGLVMSIVICLCLSLNSESRRLINFFPFLIPFLIKAADSLNWKKPYYWIFGALSLICSKVWMPFHPKKFEGVLSPSSLDFPAQFYFMNFGPWMAHKMYAVQGIAAVLLAVFIYFYMFRQLKKVHA